MILIILNHNTFDFSKQVGTREVDCEDPCLRLSTEERSDGTRYYEQPIYDFSIIPRITFDRLRAERFFWDIIIISFAFLIRYLFHSSENKNK